MGIDLILDLVSTGCVNSVDVQGHGKENIIKLADFCGENKIEVEIVLRVTRWSSDVLLEFCSRGKGYLKLKLIA